MTPARRRKTLPSFHFAVVVHGECCSRGHLWIQSYKAYGLDKAVAKMYMDIRRQGYTPVEWAQLPSPQIIGTVEETPDAGGVS